MLMGAAVIFIYCPGVTALPFFQTNMVANAKYSGYISWKEKVVTIGKQHY